MNNDEWSEKCLMLGEGSLKSVESKISRVISSVKFEVDQKRNQHYEKVLDFMFLLPMSKVIVISNQKPVANIHDKIANKERKSSNKCSWKDSPAVYMGWHYKLDHNIEDFNKRK